MSESATSAPDVSEAQLIRAAPVAAAWRTDSSGPPLPVADYLLANRRRIMIVAAVALVLAEALVGYLIQKPRDFSATATVTIPAAGSNPFDVGQAIAQYRTAVTSKSVLRDVAAATDTQFGALRGGVTVAREGTSRFVRVSYSGRPRAHVPVVARAVAVTGLEALFQPAFAAADRALTDSQKDLDGVQQQIAAFNASHGLVVDAPQTYRAAFAALTAMQARHADGAAIARKQREVDDLAVVVGDFRKLESKRSELQGVLNAAAARRGDARANLEASKSLSAVQVGRAHDATSAGQLITYGAIAFVVAFLLIFAGSALWPVAPRGDSVPRNKRTKRV